MTARPDSHAPARIWGGVKGRTIVCECLALLGPSWESVTDQIAAHVAELDDAQTKRGAA